MIECSIKVASLAMMMPVISCTPIASLSSTLSERQHVCESRAFDSLVKPYGLWSDKAGTSGPRGPTGFVYEARISPPDGLAQSFPDLAIVLTTNDDRQAKITCEVGKLAIGCASPIADTDLLI